MKVRVLLIENVEGLGAKGEIKEVSQGYANNFLFRKKLAIKATPEIINEYQQKIKSLEKKKAKEEKESRKFAELLKNTEIVIKKKAGKTGKLFGAVTQKEVADALLSQRGIRLDKKQIHFATQIKQVGEFSATAELGFGLKQEFKILVEPEQ